MAHACEHGTCSARLWDCAQRKHKWHACPHTTSCRAMLERHASHAAASTSGRALLGCTWRSPNGAVQPVLCIRRPKIHPSHLCSAQPEAGKALTASPLSVMPHTSATSGLGGGDRPGALQPQLLGSRPGPPQPATGLQRPSMNMRAARLLTRQIRATQDWLELQRLWHDMHPSFNTLNILALVHQLTQVERVQRYTRYEDTDFRVFLTEVADELRSPRHLPHLDARGAANVLWSFARLGHHPGAAWADLVLDHMTPLLLNDQCDPLSLSQTIWALARLGHKPSDAWLHNFFSAAHALLPQLSPKGMSNIIWAAASLQVCQVKLSCATRTCWQLVNPAG